MRDYSKVNNKSTKKHIKRKQKVSVLINHFSHNKSKKIKKNKKYTNNIKNIKNIENKKNKKNQSTKKQFLYNPNDPKKSFDVYIDKNPNDTIHIKYTTLDDVKNTIKKLERLYKNNSYSHKRIWQVGMIMYVRLKVLAHKKPSEFALAKKYFKFLGSRTKLKSQTQRKKINFKY